MSPTIAPLPRQMIHIFEDDYTRRGDLGHMPPEIDPVKIAPASHGGDDVRTRPVTA
jgi:hypothetical protein